MGTQLHSEPKMIVSNSHINTSKVIVSSPLGHSAAFTPASNIKSPKSNRSSSSNLAEKLKIMDFTSPAKIFQNKHAIHQFENVTPDVSGSGTPSNTVLDVDCNESSKSNNKSIRHRQLHTPRSLSPELVERYEDTRANSNQTSDLKSATSLQSTPSQFIFSKPEYDSHYHHTHFHHLEKKDTLFHDMKRFFKKNGDKKKKKTIIDEESSSFSGTSVVLQ